MECPKLLLFNPFIPNAPFCYPLQTSETLPLHWKNLALGTNGLIKGASISKTKKTGHGAGKHSKAGRRKI